MTEYKSEKKIKIPLLPLLKNQIKNVEKDFTNIKNSPDKLLLIENFSDREKPSTQNKHTKDFIINDIQVPVAKRSFSSLKTIKNKLKLLEKEGTDDENFDFLEEIKVKENSENVGEFEQLFIKSRIQEFVCFFFTLTAFGSGIIYHELNNYGANYAIDKSILQTATYFSLIMTTISTFFFICNTIYRCSVRIRIHRVNKKLLRIEGIFSSDKWVGVFCEIILSLLHPNIITHDLSFTTNKNWYNVEVTYFINDFLTIIMLSRFYIFFRFFLSFSKYYDIRSNRVGKMLGIEITRSFALKSIFISYPYFLIIYSILVFVFVLTFTIRIIEGPVSKLLKDNIDYTIPQNCLWNVIVTMTTVGYGDYSPRSTLGRFVMVSASFIGTMLISFMVVALQNYFKFNENELKVTLTLKRLQMKLDKKSF